MFEFYNKMGLESNTNTDLDKEFDELELDIIGCESAADLASSLLDYSLDSEITSLGFNSVLIAETVAGIEGVDFTEILSELGMSGRLEEGTEGIKETAKAGWYKVKAAVQAVIGAFLAFCKKVATLFTTTDKMFDRINKKAASVKTKWDAHKFAEGVEKKFDSAAKNLRAQLSVAADNIAGPTATGIIDGLVTTSGKSLTQFISDMDTLIAKGEDPTKDKSKEELKTDKKEQKDELTDVMKQAKTTESMTYSEFKSACGTLLTEIGSSSKTLSDAKTFEKIKKSIEGMEKLKKELSKIKGEDIEKVLGGEEKKQKLIKSAAVIIAQYNRLPKRYAIYAKSYGTICSVGFTEISKCMSVSK